MAAAAFVEPVSPELALVDVALADRLRASLDLPRETVAPVRRELRVVVREEPAATDVEHLAEATDQLNVSDLIVSMEDDPTEPEAAAEHAALSDGGDVEKLAAEADVDASDLIVAIEGDSSEPAAEAASEWALPSDGMDVEKLATEADLDASDLIVDALESGAGGPTASSLYPALPAPVVVGQDPMDAAEAVLREIRDRLATPAPAKRGRRFRRRFIVASGLSTAVALGVFAANAALGVTQLPV